MKIKEISANKERKIGLPGYSSATIGVSMTVSIDEPIDISDSESIEKAYVKIWEALEEQVERKLEELPIPTKTDEGEKMRWLSTKEPIIKEAPSEKTV